MSPFKTFTEQHPNDVPVERRSVESMQNYFASRSITYESPIGRIGIVAVDQDHISHLFFGCDFLFDEASDLRDRYPVLSCVTDLLARYFAGKPFDTATLPIRMESGTHFQNAVWAVIRQIPHGGVRSYKWIAERIGKPRAVRAVGGAVGANPVSILVPCHRVIRSDGTLGGYGGGIEQKRQLLALEGYQL